jgi:hypothetical protein
MNQMLDFLRTIRLGGLSIFGVALPGLLLLGFASFGLLLPVIAIMSQISPDASWMKFAEGTTGGKLIVLVMGVGIVGYTLGYVLRLFSPDKLDEISGPIVLSDMSEEERKCWPYTGCKNDKFPYFLTYEYLKARGLDKAAESVTWGADDSILGV